MDYEIVTVDWNPEQTRVWRYWVEKNCPTAKITMIKDKKPFKYCWSGGKVDCFKVATNKKTIYLDTDTIVTGDLSCVFPLMGGQPFGASQRLKMDRLKVNYPKIMPKIHHIFSLNMQPPNTSSGMLICNDFDPLALYEAWFEVMNNRFFQMNLGRHYTSEEYALSIACAKLFETPDQVWDIPYEIHANVFGNKFDKGSGIIPYVIHYHKRSWAKMHRLELDKDIKPTIEELYIKNVSTT